MGDVFMVASGKGGVGKTTLCAMLGSQFARMDKTVVMLDTDFGLRNLDLYFHLENKIIYNLVDVLKGVCSYRQALLPLVPIVHFILCRAAGIMIFPYRKMPFPA